MAVLAPCLNSASHHPLPDLEVLVVDNGSDDPARCASAGLEQQGKIRVLRDPSPFNYSALNNKAVGQATGALVCLLNNDIEWLSLTGSKAGGSGDETRRGCSGCTSALPRRTLNTRVCCLV